MFKLTGIQARSWFLALYLPGAWQGPTIAAMIALGLGMLTLALYLQLSARRRPAPQ